MGSIYGFEIKSELPLRRLNATAGTRGELVIVAASERLEPPAGDPTGELVGEDGRRWYSSYEMADGKCLLQLPPTGTFLLEPNRGRVVVDATDEDAELLEHRIVSAAVCTLLSRGSDLVLHAAAAVTDGRAVVFCGPSMRGKSTLARELGRAGCELLAEDGIAIELGVEKSIAYPGARGVRVRIRQEEGGTSTELIPDPGPGEPEPCQVAAVVLLGERTGEFEAETLEPARALALLTPNLVHSGSRDAIATAFAKLAQLLSSVPALRVSFPDDLAALPGATQRFLASTISRR